MPLGGFGWHERSTPPTSKDIAAVMAPYYNHCVEEFGVERCMFESNFPVDNQSTSYTVLWNAFKLLSKSLSPTERSSMLRDTAVRAYRIA